MSYVKNDPGFNYDVNNNAEKQTSTFNVRSKVNVKKTETLGKPVRPVFEEPSCILHPNSKHTLNECRVFRLKPMEERRKILKDFGVCFKCCASKEHLKRDCHASIVCKDCGSLAHCTALHSEPDSGPPRNYRQNGGESTKTF